MGIEQITSVKWLAMKWYQKLIDLIIYMHIVNLFKLNTILSGQCSVEHYSGLIVLSLNKLKLNRKQQ